MRNIAQKLMLTLGTIAISASAQADGKLNLYNWTDYTPTELIDKFEKETGIDVTLDTYDSNETLLAKLQSGATGYDLVVPSQHFVDIMVKEGLLMKVDGITKLPNYKYVDERFRNPSWDPTQSYSTPYQMGSASFAYRANSYAGNGSSLKEFFEPSAEACNKVAVFKSPDAVVNMAH